MTAQIIPFPKRKRPAPREPIPFPLLLLGAVVALLLIQR